MIFHYVYYINAREEMVVASWNPFPDVCFLSGLFAPGVERKK